MGKETPFEICFLFHIDYNYIDSIDKKDISPLYSNIFCKLHDGFPELPITIAPTGSFIEYASTSSKPLAYWIRNMLARGQIEILGGAFYEPLFSIIPQGDLTAQIEMLTEAIRKEFAKKVRGCFVPFSAWEPHLVEPLKKSGINYCLLDSRLFRGASLKPYQPSLMEHNGKTIFALPVEYSLSAINTFTPKDLLDYLMNLSYLNNSCLILPVTAETLNDCFNEENGISWFAEFIHLIEDSPIIISHAGKLIKNKKIYQKGIISSNAVLNGKLLGSTLKKTIFINPTLSTLYSKIFYVHSLCNQVRGDKARKNAALEYLWKAEDACLLDIEGKHSQDIPILLQMAYRNILLAEKQTRTQGLFSTSLLNLDINMDGAKEFLFQREDMNIYVHSIGAKVFELDVFSVYKNYTYIEKKLGLFIDHIIAKNDLVNIKKKDYASISTSSTFANNFYQDDAQNKIKGHVHFETKGIVGSKNIDVSLQKLYQLTDNGIQVQYFLRNDSNSNLVSNFMVELSLSFEVSGKKKSKLSAYSQEMIQEISIEDLPQIPVASSVSWVQLEGVEGKIKFMIELNEQASMMVLPVYKKHAESSSDNIVGVRLLFYWVIKLRPHRETEKMVFFKMFNIKNKNVKM